MKAPSFGDNRKAILNDIAVLTGSTVISEDLGITLEDSDVSILGTCGKIEVSKEDTVILNGSGDKYIFILFLGLPSKKESIKSKNKSRIQPVHTTKKNFKKDCLNLSVGLASSKSVEVLKSKLVKLKIEFKMLSVLHELPLNKVL